jgi:hypothetical protein
MLVSLLYKVAIQMGDRSEIYVRNKDLTIELWKHWDSDPDFMIPFFEKFSSFAINTVGHNQHLLTYPETVAALLIAFDYEEHKKTLEKLRKKYKNAPDYLFVAKPDIRPRGNIQDFQRIWILDIPNINESGVWKISHYDVSELDFLPPNDEREDLKPHYRGIVNMTIEEFRKAIHECRELPIKPTVEKVILRVTVPAPAVIVP